MDGPVWLVCKHHYINSSSCPKGKKIWSFSSPTLHQDRKKCKKIKNVSLASSSTATSLSSWLFDGTKVADSAGAAVLTATDMEELMKPLLSTPPTTGAGERCRLFLQDVWLCWWRENRGRCTSISSCFICMDALSHLFNTELIKAGRPASAYSYLFTDLFGICHQICAFGRFRLCGSLYH